MWARLSRDAEHGLSGERAADHEPEHPRRATSACRGHRVTRRREQGTGRDSEQEALGRGRAAYFRRDGLGVGVEGLGVGVGLGDWDGLGDGLGEGPGDPPTVSVTVALVPAERPLAAGTRSRKENVPAAVAVHWKVHVPPALSVPCTAVVQVPLVRVCRVTVVPAKLCGCTVAVKVTGSPTAGAMGAAWRAALGHVPMVACGD